jgi:hypothetical protein
MALSAYSLDCTYVRYDSSVWERIIPVSLVDVVTGGEVAEPTLVHACWDEKYVYVRFDCCDDYAVSQYTNRDEPLYDQDVVEAFIDEDGAGTDYLEFEVSPNNVVFDAAIRNNGSSITVGLEWDAEGWETAVHEDGQGNRIYELKFPHAIFLKAAPAVGVRWRVNFYRIDEDRSGVRHYQAWSPTGILKYHVPSRFGTMTFVRGGES